MNLCFQKADMMVPKEPAYEKWAVIACDQHTSDLRYWEQLREFVGDAPSSLSVILPEAELSQLNRQRIDSIHKAMKTYVDSSVFEKYSDSFIYVERTLQDGSIRQGVVGVIDLEQYNIPSDDKTKVFATEMTVAERLPPRISIRDGAGMEFSHTVVFCNDPDMELIEPLADRKDRFEKLYDFNLMMGGGHIAGWRIGGMEAEDFQNKIARYEADHIYLVGDGNHSLLTAKRIYEARKADDPDGDWENALCRYAMVELENIHSPAMRFEAIHRVITNVDVNKLIGALQELNSDEGLPVTLVVGEDQHIIQISVSENQLLIGVLQEFLDQWLADNPGQIDYIHGKSVVRELAQQPGAVGIILPDFRKEKLFPYIRSGKITPRKTFSIGKASEKRYYLEGRMIL